MERRTRRHSGVRPGEAFVLSNVVARNVVTYMVLRTQTAKPAQMTQRMLCTGHDLPSARSREANSTIDNKSEGHAP
jgi:hypothetical protein